MQLTLNGERKSTKAQTVAALIVELGLDIRKVAIERNGAIVARSLHETTALNEGDTLEVVHFIGGG